MTTLEQLFTATFQYSSQLRKAAEALKAYETNTDEAKEKMLSEQYLVEKQKAEEYNNRVQQLTQLCKQV